MKQHVVSALVENRAGTLSRVSGLFSRRGFNIDSLTVGETENPRNFYNRRTGFFVRSHLDQHYLPAYTGSRFQFTDGNDVYEFSELFDNLFKYRVVP